MARYYVDHNASSPLFEAAADAMRRALDATMGNASSVHQSGQRSRAVVEQTRRLVRRTLGVSGGRVVFTSGATEANNLVLRALLATPGDVVTSRLEHPSVFETLAESGRQVHFVGHDARGRLDLEHLRTLLANHDVAAVSLMAGNNELGNLNPVSEIAEICAAAPSQPALHVDAVQVFGRIPFQVPDTVSAVTISAHKMGGPKGLGAAWLRSSQPARPLFAGGQQERGWRPGTENVLAHAGWAAALRAPRDWRQVAPVRDFFETAMCEAGALVNGDLSARLPNTSNLHFPGVDAEGLLMSLDLAGVECSAGSACTAGSIEPSKILTALFSGDDARAAQSLRFSFGPEHTIADATAIASIVRKHLADAVG